MEPAQLSLVAGIEATVTDLAAYKREKFDTGLIEKPSEVLPLATDLHGAVCFDLETTGLFADAGATVAVVAVAYRRKSDPGFIWYHSFAFDQGNAQDKGFVVHYHPELDPTKKLTTHQKTMDKYKYAGKPMGDPEGMWDWDADYNLSLQEWVVLCRWLQEAGSAVGLLNQNLKFDLGLMRKGTRFCEGVELEMHAVWDTMLVSPLVWPYAGTTALKPVAARIWGEEEVAEAQEVQQALLEVKKRFKLGPDDGPRYDLMPVEVVLPYAAQDAVLTLRLAELQMAMLEEGYGSINSALRAIDLMRVLRRMERRGLGPLDVQTAEQIADEIDERVAKLKVGLPFEPTGSKAARYFFDDMGHIPWKVNEERRIWAEIPDTRKTAKPGAMRIKLIKQGDCSAVVAKRMAEAGVEWAAEWAEITELSIANRMFYRNYADLRGTDDHLRADFKQAFVRSGRLSAARVQLHGMPKHLGLSIEGKELVEPKKLILTPAGRVRMNLDLSQAELRIGALLCDCALMGDALAANEDLHAITAVRVLGAHPDAPNWKTMRDAGKQGNFSYIYGVGPDKFRTILWERADLEWSLDQSKAFVYSWRDTYYQFPAAFHEWMAFAERNHYVKLADGSVSWMTQPRDFSNSAWNRVVQGSLAIFVREWLVMIEKKTARYDALCLSVHDSACLLLPEDGAQEICEELAEETQVMWTRMFGIPGRADISTW